jgi:phosphatidylglycerol:prolipoprotein diacylglycerol transferase
MHSTALKLGSLTLHWYGVLVAVGFLTGLWTASRRAPRAGLRGDAVADLGPWLIVGALVGSRVLYVITYWNTLFDDPLIPGAPWTEVFMIHRGGLVYYGGLIGAALAYVIVVRWKQLPLWRLADVLSPSIALGCVFGRLGCLMNGCCYGRPCDLPWAIRFPADSLAWRQHRALGLADEHGLSAPVHPTQIYDALFNLALYAGLAWLFRRRKFDGQVFTAYLMGYAALRSVVELFRGDYAADRPAGGFTPAHLTSLVVFAAGAVAFTCLRQRGKQAAPPRH